MAAVLKTARGSDVPPGFESLTLRNNLSEYLLACENAAANDLEQPTARSREGSRGGPTPPRRFFRDAFKDQRNLAVQGPASRPVPEWSSSLRRHNGTLATEV